MENAASMVDSSVDSDSMDSDREPANLNTLLLSIRGRHSSNSIDKVCAIAFPFQKRGSLNSHNVTFPIYDPSTPVSVAWERLISSIASAKMEHGDLWHGSREFLRITTIQLLCLFPHPSRHHWFPSWAQVQQYPDVSIRDPIPVARDMDYSLRIISGRIYRGCLLGLKRRPTSKDKAAYYCFMGSKLVELVATVPGVEPNIDSKRKYILIDISPDYSLWPSEEHRDYTRLVEEHKDCSRSLVGHVHPPIWRESVIIVCEEVDRLEYAEPVRATTGSPEILRYRLHRITTLNWDCRLPREEYTRWLPFKPSLEHMRSAVCSAVRSKGELHSVIPLCPPDVFCDPAAVAGLPITNGRREWDKCLVYEVYLV